MDTVSVGIRPFPPGAPSRASRRGGLGSASVRPWGTETGASGRAAGAGCVGSDGGGSLGRRAVQLGASGRAAGREWSVERGLFRRRVVGGEERGLLSASIGPAGGGSACPSPTARLHEATLLTRRGIAPGPTQCVQNRMKRPGYTNILQMS